MRAAGVVSCAGAVVLLCLAGCTDSPTPVTSVSVPGLLGSGGGTGGGLGGPVGTGDVCTAYPIREVAKETGWRLSTAMADAAPIASLSPSGCRYAGSDGTIRLLVVRGGGDAALTALATSPELGGGAIAVTGLGDAAQATLDGLAVRYGPDVIAVVERPAGSPLSLAVAERLATSLRGRLS